MLSYSLIAAETQTVSSFPFFLFFCFLLKNETTGCATSIHFGLYHDWSTIYQPPPPSLVAKAGRFYFKKRVTSAASLLLLVRSILFLFGYKAKRTEISCRVLITARPLPGGTMSATWREQNPLRKKKLSAFPSR